jgi:hypothetical protein
MTSLPKKRPAELGGAAGSVAILVAWALGVDDAGIIAAIGVVVGFVPAAITWTVTTVRKPRGNPAP